MASRTSDFASSDGLLQTDSKQGAADTGAAGDLPASKCAESDCSSVDSTTADSKQNTDHVGAGVDFPSSKCEESDCRSVRLLEADAKQDATHTGPDVHLPASKCEESDCSSVGFLEVDSKRDGVPAPPVLHIGDLRLATKSPWAFVAWVIAKHPARAWKSWHSTGTLQDVYVADTLHGCTRVTLFDDAITAYGDVVVPGKTYYFAGGRLKRAFASMGAVEISFGSGSDIHLAPALPIVPQISAIRLADIAALPDGSIATTIAVIHALGGVKQLVTKKGKTTAKRELLLVDDSDFRMVCTTWGQLARDAGDFSEGSVVVIKDDILTSYNNLRSSLPLRSYMKLPSRVWTSSARGTALCPPPTLSRHSSCALELFIETRSFAF